MARLARGDVLVVTRLDRLARSTRDLLNLLGTIREKGAATLPRFRTQKRPASRKAGGAHFVGASYQIYQHNTLLLAWCKRILQTAKIRV